MALIPENEYSLYNSFETYNYPTTSWLINEDTHTLEYSNDNQKLIKQSIDIRLQIERCQHPIFTNNAGMQTLDLPGQDLGLILAKLKRRIIGCLQCDDRIYGIDNFNYEQLDNHSILVTFNVNTIFGDISMEEEYNV